VTRECIAHPVATSELSPKWVVGGRSGALWATPILYGTVRRGREPPVRGPLISNGSGQAVRVSRRHRFRVDRDTPRVSAASAIGSPLTPWTRSIGTRARGRPSRRPWVLARCSPARTRSRIRSRSNSALCKAPHNAEHFFARRRGAKMPNRDDVLIATTVGEEWIGLNRRPDARLYGD
jgi:hypothetical protein